MNTTLDPRRPSDEAREPILRAPLVVTALLVTFAVVHVGSFFLSDAQFQYLFDSFALSPARFAYFGWHGQGGTADALFAYVPLVTYSFLHGDNVHLILNLLWFLIFATPVARRVGALRFLGICLVATLGAAMTHLMFHWGSDVPVVGASGAVSGLTGAAFRFVLIDHRTTPVWPPQRLPLLSRPVLLLSAVWVALNIVLGVIGFTPEGFERAIAWEAHLGGYFAGLLAFPLFDRRRSWMS